MTVKVRAIAFLYIAMYNVSVDKISVSDFRQKCLALMDDLPAEGVLITKHGQPVAKIVPVDCSPAALIGCAPNLATDPADDLLSTGIRWDAES